MNEQPLDDARHHAKDGRRTFPRCVRLWPAVGVRGFCEARMDAHGRGDPVAAEVHRIASGREPGEPGPCPSECPERCAWFRP